MLQKVLCPKCGATAYATEAFCPACGEMLKGAKPAPAPPVAAPAPQPTPPPAAVLPSQPPPPPPSHPALTADRSAVFPLSPDMVGGLATQNFTPEDLVFSIENEEGAVALAGTLDSVLVLRTGDMAGGFSGINIKVYPYGSISDVRGAPGPMTGKIQFTVHLFGGKPEVGRRARMSGQKKVENIAALPNEQIPLVADKFSEMVANLSDV